MTNGYCKIAIIFDYDWLIFLRLRLLLDPVLYWSEAVRHIEVDFLVQSVSTIRYFNP